MRVSVVKAVAAVAEVAGRRDRVALAASILRTLTEDERSQAVNEAADPEPDGHVRRTFARLTRSSAD